MEQVVRAHPRPPRPSEVPRVFTSSPILTRTPSGRAVLTAPPTRALDAPPPVFTAPPTHTPSATSTPAQQARGAEVESRPFLLASEQKPGSGPEEVGPQRPPVFFAPPRGHETSPRTPTVSPSQPPPEHEDPRVFPSPEDFSTEFSTIDLAASLYASVLAHESTSATTPAVSSIFASANASTATLTSRPIDSVPQTYLSGPYTSVAPPHIRALREETTKSSVNDFTWSSYGSGDHTRSTQASSFDWQPSEESDWSDLVITNEFVFDNPDSDWSDDGFEQEERPGSVVGVEDLQSISLDAAQEANDEVSDEEDGRNEDANEDEGYSADVEASVVRRRRVAHMRRSAPV